MDVVDVMAAHMPVLRVCTAQSREALESASLDWAVHTGTRGKYAVITPTTSVSTDKIEPLL